MLARPIIEAMKTAPNLNLFRTLPALAPRLKPEDAYVLASQIVDLMKATTNLNPVLMQALEESVSTYQLTFPTAVSTGGGKAWGCSGTTLPE